MVESWERAAEASSLARDRAPASWEFLCRSSSISALLSAAAASTHPALSATNVRSPSCLRAKPLTLSLAWSSLHRKSSSQPCNDFSKHSTTFPPTKDFKDSASLLTVALDLDSTSRTRRERLAACLASASFIPLETPASTWAFTEDSLCSLKAPTWARSSLMTLSFSASLLLSPSSAPGSSALLDFFPERASTVDLPDAP